VLKSSSSKPFSKILTQNNYADKIIDIQKTSDQITYLKFLQLLEDQNIHNIAELRSHKYRYIIMILTIFYLFVVVKMFLTFANKNFQLIRVKIAITENL